ncbi:ABC transporter ATP-binding protein [Rhizobium sp. SSA_523]|uniref:ABC transporter ATP-binding protein n=1 Tax=Rhizobium sp. SSA_523 TaxID=2952477 RepID=UPI002090BB51|nr:ABC transporter ATP-binding protein [Rhizobium sp. SSA_523]MCO5733452.1 ABC transporter ATP-binding protein [Rhizobium sp. SSA_523]WKC21579.1 ABC transporter ATP-binding protein [Rhizobium sp. SSA_523]
MSNVRLSSIRKTFGQTPVLHGIDLQIASGEFVSLLGASGCGKTTLLRIVAGLEGVSSGSVEIDGRDVTALPPEQRDIAMMFQSYALLPHLSVIENVRFPLRMRGIGSRDDQYDRARAALETVQLAHLADRRPRQLSGGQQQRVALARAVVSNPKVLLLDEPLSNLDARLREEMQLELIEIHRRLKLTTLFVTHDQEEALSLSDRVVLMNAGRIEQQATPHDLYATPATRFASSFVGATNLLAATIAEEGGAVFARLGEQQHLPVAPSVTHRGPATLAIRQEDLVISQARDTLAPGQLAGEIVTRVYLGSRYRYIVDLGEHRLTILAPKHPIFETGETVAISVDQAHIRPLVE